MVIVADEKANFNLDNVYKPMVSKHNDNIYVKMLMKFRYQNPTIEKKKKINLIHSITKDIFDFKLLVDMVIGKNEKEENEKH